MALDISKWKEFTLPEIFNDISIATSNDLGHLSEGFVPFIGRTADNNGLQAYVYVEEDKIIPKDCITVSMVGTYVAQWQDTDFAASQNILILRDNRVTKAVGLFLCSEINFNLKDGYSMGRTFKKSDAEKVMLLRLPVNSNGNIDYQFMEDYINGLDSDISTIPDYFLNEGYNKACWYMDNIDIDKFETEYAGVHTPADIKLSDRDWKEFQIQDIFDTYTGGDLILGNVVEGDIPIASHTSENNGIDSYTMEIEGRPLFDHKKSISLADRGTFFAAHQKDDFYIGTRVKAMVFKDDIFNSNTISSFAIDFIVTVINHEQFRFSYGRNCTNGLDTLVIKLPVDSNGNPDYQFMEDYIKSRPFSANI